jgi:hypothetical protein
MPAEDDFHYRPEKCPAPGYVYTPWLAMTGGGAEYQVGFTVGQQAFYRLSGRQQVMMFNVKV